MIDWLGVLTNGLWIVGLAALLATVSYYEYIASQQGKPRHIVFGAPRVVFYLSLAMTLFCLGVALSGGRWWERIAWGILALLFAWQAWQKYRA